MLRTFHRKRQRSPGRAGAACSQLLTERAAEVVQHETQRLERLCRRLQLHIRGEVLQRAPGAKRPTVHASHKVVHLRTCRPETRHHRGVIQGGQLAHRLEPQHMQALMNPRLSGQQDQRQWREEGGLLPSATGGDVSDPDACGHASAEAGVADAHPRRAR